jgi:serine/threonine protein kinase
MAKKCPMCLTEWHDEMQFCPHDGTPLRSGASDVDWDAMLSSPETAQKTVLPCRAGDVLGSYRLVEQLGEGGMATVFRATHKLLGRQVAIKALLPELAEHPEAIQRFFKEGQAVNRINHPAIVEITDFVSDDKHPPYIVMEMLEGESLAHHIHVNAPIPPEEAIKLILPVCSALQAMHDIGIVHRDLKPDNVLLVRAEDGSFAPKLIDFGIAKFMASAEAFMKTRTGQLIGTPEYMAPELIRGENIDLRIDIYAMGIMLYEMLTGKPPFQGSLNNLFLRHLNETPTPPSERLVDVDLPPALDEAVMRCLEKDPADRIQSMSQLREILEWTTEDRKTKVVVLSDIPQDKKRRRGWIAAAGGAALCMAGLVAWIFGFGKTRPVEGQLASAVDLQPLKGWLTAARAQETPLKPRNITLRSLPTQSSVFRLSDGRFMGQTPLVINMVNGQREAFLVRADDHNEARVSLGYQTRDPVLVAMLPKKLTAANPAAATDPSSSHVDANRESKTPAAHQRSRRKRGRPKGRKSSGRKNRRRKSRPRRRHPRHRKSKTSTVNPFE